jgi:hypothetical protein
MTTFPSEKLQPRGGSIRALLFGNADAGAPLDVYWKVDVAFEPLELGDAEEGSEPSLLHCGALAEWMRLGERDWRKLDGREARDPGPGEGFEASFYAGKRLGSQDARIAFRGRDGASFEVTLDMIVDLTRVLDLTEGPTTISKTLRLPFEGLMLDVDVADAKSGDAAAALEAARPFIDPAAYGAPELRTNQFGVKAWWLPPRVAG